MKSTTKERLLNLLDVVVFLGFVGMLAAFFWGQYVVMFP